MNLLEALIISTFCCYVCSYDERPEFDDYVIPSSFNEALDPLLEDSVPDVVALVAETGDAGYLGEVVKAGIEKALEDKKKLCSRDQKCLVPSITFNDTQSSPQKALHLFQHYYSKGVRTFVGLVTSDEAKAVAEYASNDAPHAILISPTSTATELCKYKQLHRLSMDDRGFAEALFDLAISLRNKDDSTMSIQVIYKSGIHGQGLYKDIFKRFYEASSQGYKVLSPISYERENSLTNSNVVSLIKKLRKSPAIEKKNSLIILIGLSEAQLVLQEAAKHSLLKNLMWIVSDTFTLSNMKIPDDMNVFGLAFEGEEAESRLLSKERYGLHKYLESKKLPPMVQAQFAYDIINILPKGKSLSHISNSMVLEGLTGPLEFSKCRDRFSGSYLFAVSPKSHDIDNLARKVLMRKWMVISHFSVKSSDRNIQFFHQLDDYSPEAMMEATLQSTSKKGVTSLAAPSVEIKKIDFIKQLVQITDKTCEKNAQLIIRSIDELSETPVNATYAVSQMPETIVLPAKYGFVMIATCRTKTLNLQLTRVCPATKVGGSEIICQTRVKTTALGQVTDEGRGCTATKIVQGTCIVGAGACFIAAILITGATFAPVCGLVGTLGCGSVTMVRGEVCEKGKFVCTELFRQGFLSPDIMLADMSFAKHYSVDFPITRKGYDILGPTIASWMSSSEWVTNIAKYIAVPWAEEMAYNEGYRELGNDFGATVMNIGSVVCALVGGLYIYFNYIIGGAVMIAFLVALKKTQMKSYVPLAKKIN